MHGKYDLKVRLIWIPKYRKRVLAGQTAERTRDLLRQICMDHKVQIISGNVAPDHVHMFVSYRLQMLVNKLVQHLKGRVIPCWIYVIFLNVSPACFIFFGCGCFFMTFLSLICKHPGNKMPAACLCEIRLRRPQAND